MVGLSSRLCQLVLTSASVMSTCGLDMPPRYARRADGNATETDFEWYTIIPSPELVWTSCYSTLECARLELPLDYEEPAGRMAAIALVRAPAQVPRDSAEYKGPILFNPGGPGGSGVEFMLEAAAPLSTLIGPQFDLVGFDPRGISRSTPRANFFATDVERALFSVQVPVIRNGVADISKPWAESRLYGKLAAVNDDGYLKHINTQNTATDMLRIVEAYGQKKLQYWGFSYGTVLGATFAAMYPDKVERLVIDGVVDADEYYAAAWLNDTVDSPKGLSLFFENCAKAGPDQCSFHSPDPDTIRRNLNELYEKLRREPLVVESQGIYGIVDETTLRRAIFMGLYVPAQWKSIAAGLKAAAAGDGLPILQIMSPQRFNCSCDPHEHEFDNIPEGSAAVACNDGDGVPSTLAEFQSYFDKLAKVSLWPDIWGSLRLGCTGWPNAKKGFRGPFIANTSHPLLVIGSTADPVTPLRSAEKMAKGFRGSVVLTQDAPGHSSLLIGSSCTMLHVRTYFQNGTLPEPNTICLPDVENPFLGGPGGGNSTTVGSLERRGSETAEDKLRGAISELSQKFRPSLPFYKW